MHTQRQHPIVSIVMPTYHAQATLDAALSSIAAQTFPGFELIIVDDGSGDDTVRIARAWCERDTRFRLFSQEHASAGAARNLGMGEARGDYLLFLDADDVFDRDLLSYLLAAATETGAEVVACEADCFVDDPASPVRPWGAGGSELAMGFYTAGRLRHRLYQCTTTVLWNKLFSCELVRRAGASFQDQPRFNDAFFTIVALAHARTLCKIDKVLVHYRVGAGTSLVDREADMPLCDIAALDAARAVLSAQGMLDRVLKRSFDTLCVNTITWRLAHIARASEQATRELYEAYFGSFEHSWGLSRAHWPYLRSARYALECKLMKAAGAEGLLAASAPDTRDRASKRDVLAEARFVMRLCRAACHARGREGAYAQAR